MVLTCAVPFGFSSAMLNVNCPQLYILMMITFLGGSEYWGRVYTPSTVENTDRKKGPILTTFQISGF